MLNGLPVLVVEDETVLATRLQNAIEGLDGLTIGPVTSVDDALALLQSQTVAAVIIDANSQIGDISPLALELLQKAVPFVIHTDTALPAALAALDVALPIVVKPAAPTAVLAALLQQVASDRGPFVG